MHYRKIATIEAFQLNPYDPGVPKWFADAIETGVASRNSDDSWTIKTLEGDHRANPDDWIARGVKGELWPIKPDIFAASYEPVNYDALEAGAAAAG